jgi:hypothetical protein
MTHVGSQCHSKNIYIYIYIYILEKKEEQPKEENAIGIAATFKSCSLYCQNTDEQKMFFNSF